MTTATKLTDLYDVFLSKITDYRLADMTREEIEENLFSYFKIAKAKFYRCKKSLELDDNGYFKDNIDYFELEILATLMLVEHIKPQLISSENMKQSLSDKDFKIYSQANQLRELRLLYDSIRKEVKKMITEYTFINLGKEDKQ